MKRTLIQLSAVLISVIPLAVFAQLPGSDVDLLPETEAFQVIAQTDSSDQLLISWRIAPEYYMYQDKFAVVPVTEGVQFGEAVFPTGKSIACRFSIL